MSGIQVHCMLIYLSIKNRPRRPRKKIRKRTEDDDENEERGQNKLLFNTGNSLISPENSFPGKILRVHAYNIYTCGQ